MKSGTMKHRPLYWLTAFLALLPLVGCATRAPSGVAVVPAFDPERYLGTWYEMARLDHRFERGMSEVTAVYTANPDGSLGVVNRAWNGTRWKSVTGRATFQKERTVPSLSVTFFWPFSGGYHVIALDQADYRWAMVCGPDRDYLWILARTPVLDPSLRDTLVLQAKNAGFPVTDLIWVEHGKVPQPVP